MVVVGLALAGVAALVHVYIFFLESVAWTSQRALSTFGTDAGEAEATKELAFNQGFYNLFLAIGVALGIVLVGVGEVGIGATLVFFATGSMVAASAVLMISSPSKAVAALKQGVVPLLAVISLAIGIAAAA